MPDIMATGQWGRDDGIKCDCGGKAYLVDDQGLGLCDYVCEDCDLRTRHLFSLSPGQEAVEPAGIKCDGCQAPMEMEEDPEDFFAFMQRQAA
jgi:hypothetical protein